MKQITVSTAAREEFVRITGAVQDEVSATGVKDGLCTIYVPHTTAGVTINEGADPDVVRDMLMALQKIVHDDWPYRHAEGNSPAHMKASLMGNSATVFVRNGKLQLGTWQAIFFCEFDGPRTRRVWIHVSAAA